MINHPWPTIPVMQPIEAKVRAMPHLPDWDDLKKLNDEVVEQIIEESPMMYQARLPTKLMKCDTCDYHSNQPAWKHEWQCQICRDEAESGAIEAQDGYDAMCDENRTFGR